MKYDIYIDDIDRMSFKAPELFMITY